MKTLHLLLAVSMLVIIGVGPAWADEKWRSLTPLPDDAVVEPVPVNSPISPKAAALSGVWHGEWQVAGAVGSLSELPFGFPTTIVIERFVGNNVQAIFALGASNSYK